MDVKFYLRKQRENRIAIDIYTGQSKEPELRCLSDPELKFDKCIGFIEGAYQVIRESYLSKGHTWVKMSLVNHPTEGLDQEVFEEIEKSLLSKLKNINIDPRTN